MESPVSLQYPNGRTHEASVTTRDGLSPGDQFEMYGRHWQAVKSVRTPGRSPGADTARTLCLSVDSRTEP